MCFHHRASQFPERIRVEGNRGRRMRRTLGYQALVASDTLRERKITEATRELSSAL